MDDFTTRIWLAHGLLALALLCIVAEIRMEAKEEARRWAWLTRASKRAPNINE